jgi:hypothetical protein
MNTFPNGGALPVTGCTPHLKHGTGIDAQSQHKYAHSIRVPSTLIADSGFLTGADFGRARFGGKFIQYAVHIFVAIDAAE